MFPERHHTRSFSLQHALPCRSYRLRITAVRDPASANSVQLARLDLYLPLDPATQPTLPLLWSVTELQAAVEQAAESGPGSVVAQSLSTLLRVLTNIVQHPTESKHRTLRMENAKVKAMLLGHKETLTLLRSIGFTDSQLARQGKQPPEAALTLHSSETTSQAAVHALALLQSPMPVDLIQQDAVSPALGQQVKQSDSGQLQQLEPQPANMSDATVADQAVTSKSAGQQLQPTSAQPSLQHLARPSAEQHRSTDVSCSEAVSVASADVQATMDGSDSPVQRTAVSGAAAAGGGASDTTEGSAAEASSQPVPETPGLLDFTAGTAQSRQDRFQQTPAYAQPAPQTPPDAPQRQTHATVPKSALIGLHKLQLQTPAAADTQAASTPALTTGSRNLEGVAEKAGSPVQRDLKSLIHQEFARLMASKTYTPNEAAVLAVKNVSEQQ